MSQLSPRPRVQKSLEVRNEFTRGMTNPEYPTIFCICMHWRNQLLLLWQHPGGAGRSCVERWHLYAARVKNDVVLDSPTDRKNTVTVVSARAYELGVKKLIYKYKWPSTRISYLNSRRGKHARAEWALQGIYVIRRYRADWCQSSC